MKKYIETQIRGITSNYAVQNLIVGFDNLLSDRITKIALVIAIGIILIGAFGPMIAPYEYDESHFDEDGLERYESPSLKHPLGTTQRGEDVLSRLLFGARPTVATGLAAGSIILTLGLLIGLTSGYMGGWIDSVLMRFTDFAYGIPLIPFAIVLTVFFGSGFWATVLIIGILLWRSTARVIRSQVLQIRERTYIQAMEATGASSTRIILKHILPNVASMAILFFALNVGWAILLQAGLAFIGVTNPFVPSWGVMIRNAYNTGRVTELWWYSFPPGILISITVLSMFLIGRGYEATTEEYTGDN